jgi:hypothetical protein
MTVNCDNNGRFSVNLNANNDAGTTPANTYYAVHVYYFGAWLETRNVQILAAQAPTVDLSTLSEFQPSTSNRPVVTGSKGSNAALTSLMSALVSLGLVTDNTT